MDSALLERLDAALGRLRRLWESPQLRRRFLERLGEPVDPGAIRTLRALERCEADEPGVRHLAVDLAIDASTASRMVDQVVRAGYVERTASPTDRRRCLLSLTTAGEDLLGRANQVRAALLAEWVDDWADADVERLTELLGRLGDAVFADDRDLTTAGSAG